MQSPQHSLTNLGTLRYTTVHSQVNRPTPNLCYHTRSPQVPSTHHVRIEDQLCRRKLSSRASLRLTSNYVRQKLSSSVLLGALYRSKIHGRAAAATLNNAFIISYSTHRGHNAKRKATWLGLSYRLPHSIPKSPKPESRQSMKRVWRKPASNMGLPTQA